MDRKIQYVIAALLIVLGGAAFLVLGNPEGDTTNTTADGTLPNPGVISASTYTSAFVDADVEHFLIDVRTPSEFRSERIAGAVNIPLQDLEAGIGFDQIPEGVPVVLYCQSDRRSGLAYDILANQPGIENALYDLDGGIGTWMARGYPVE